jgi:hypothetical protein
VNVFFDVLDTLLSEEDIPRPHAREVFCRLREIGHEVYLWSSAGGAYAAEAADLLGVADLIGGCFGKRHEPDVAVDFVVDDDASVVESYGGYRVAPFEGDPWDEELLRVPEAVEASRLPAQPPLSSSAGATPPGSLVTPPRSRDLRPGSLHTFSVGAPDLSHSPK